MKFHTATCLVTAALALSPSAFAQERGTFAFVDVTVVDVAGKGLVHDQTVIVEGKRVVSVGPAGMAKVSTAARVIDARGKYVLPGLWDMHVHVLWEPAVDTLLPLMVANGVTGARDMHTHFPFEQFKAWVADVESGKRVGPRFVYAGPIVDGPQPIWPGSIPVDDPEAGRQAVRNSTTRQRAKRCSRSSRRTALGIAPR